MAFSIYQLDEIDESMEESEKYLQDTEPFHEGVETKVQLDFFGERVATKHRGTCLVDR